MKKTLTLVFALIATLILLVSCTHQHRFGDWKVLKSASCTENGLEARYCACGEKQSEVIYAKNHNYINGLCTFCNEQATPATCQHKNIVGISALAPTCTTDGRTEGEYCHDCNAVLTESMVIKGHHDFDNGFCTVCGAKSNVLLMEAEYTFMDNVEGGGTGDNTSGLCMICGYGTDSEKEMWSNGYYVGYMYNDNTLLTFEFNSSAATTATICFRLACDGDLVLKCGENLDILVNGEAQYFQWSINYSARWEPKFYDYKLTVNLVEGTNKIKFDVLKRMGCLIDYVEVETSDSCVELSWEPHEDNPYRRDNEV